MEIYIVGVYRGNKDTIKGFKLLGFDGVKNEVMNVAYNDALAKMKAGVKIENATIENGEIKGINGSLGRYGEVGKTQVIVILRAIEDSKGNVQGFICANTMGVVKELDYNTVVKLAKQVRETNGVGIANGKMLEYGDSITIAPITGSYKVVKKASSSNIDNNREKKINQLKPEVIELINQLKSYPAYKESYVVGIVNTVEKNQRCSFKQKLYMERELEKFKAKEIKAEPIKAEPIKAEPIKAEPIKAEPINYTPTDGSLFETTKIKNQLFIKGFNKKISKEDTNIDLIIPDKITVDGKEEKVIGITAMAFQETMIRSLVTGRYIMDIGQGAFEQCKNLKEVDLGKSVNTLIAINTFAYCNRLEKVKMGQYVQRIHEGAFKECIRLESVEIPDSVEIIARQAFECCSEIKEINSKVKQINDGAFRGCRKLKQFNFSNVINIGSQAFKDTGIEELVIPGNVQTIGVHAFSNCRKLKRVELNEGIRKIGDCAFGKYFKSTDTEPVVKLEELIACKSIEEIGADAFRGIELVKVYTGSLCESHCISYGVPFERLDSINKDNSTKIRIKSKAMGINSIEMLNKILDTPVANASNPDNYIMKEDKLVNIPFNETNFKFFGIEETTEQKEPHIKFKAIVNILQDTCDLYTMPLTNDILRLQDTFKVKSEAIYNDGCNRVYKVEFIMLDTLDNAGFIMVIMNNTLRYVAELKVVTDIKTSKDLYTDDKMELGKYLHIGDKIGADATICGTKCNLEFVNVGRKLFNRIERNALEIITQKKNSIYYIPSEEVVIEVHDRREWDKEDNRHSGNEKVLARGSEDCLNVINVMTYEEFVEYSKTFKSHPINSNKWFKDVSKLTNTEVEQRKKFLSNVANGGVSDLYLLSKEFNRHLGIEGKEIVSNKLGEIIFKNDSGEVEVKHPTPNDLTRSIFLKLAKSYWIIEKDSKWLEANGKKSLNKIDSYRVDNIIIDEYKSNQIVKFSNPYMNGKKGAYIFVVTSQSNNGLIGIYASKYDLSRITNKLAELANIVSGTEIQEIMTNPEQFDICSHKLFSKFYDVLYSKDGWKFESFMQRARFWKLLDTRASFHISMFKPTGVFYLVMHSFKLKTENFGEKKRLVAEGVVIPIIPIGNMDRALMIATTTNSKNRGSELLEELMVLSLQVLRLSSGKDLSSLSEEDLAIVNKYIEVRKMAFSGERDINKYKALVSDRIAYMVGTVGGKEIYEDEELEMELSESDIEDDDIDIEISEDELFGEDE